MRKISSRLMLCTFFSILCTHLYAEAIAPGAPGVVGHWSYAGKTGIGSAYENYTEGTFIRRGENRVRSRVWFSLAQGILTETMFGLIHEAQLQEAEFYIQGPDFLHEEKSDLITTIDYLDKDEKGRPLSLAYKIINRDKQNRYEIEKHIFTDPDNNSLIMKVFFRSYADDTTAYLYINPNINNTDPNDKAWIENNTWFAAEGNTTLTLKTDATVRSSSVGFEGVSDGLSELKHYGKLKHHYTTTGKKTGNVAMLLQMPSLQRGQTAEWEFVFGFGDTQANSIQAATASLKKNYNDILDHYNGKGDLIGWEDYLASLPELTRLSSMATDNGKLLYTSAMVLKAQEDKTYAGAMIASLSNPWGDTVKADTAKTGYKAVWPRDFYQVTMALLALGDTQTPKVAFQYLKRIQANENTPNYKGTPGWFLQKTQVDGTLEWTAVQLDQTAMPIMLAWQLWKQGVISEAELKPIYDQTLKSAAIFLVDGGRFSLNDKITEIKPPFTQQERWEEQSGYSPSTTAAVISGLVAAADIAQHLNDDANAKRFIAAADVYNRSIEKTMFTTQGVFHDAPTNGNYFLRITANDNPNDQSALADRNAQSAVNESEIVDAGFLELVRYGVRAPKDISITDSIPEIDNTNVPDALRLKYDFSFSGVEGTFPGWRRYGKDGYGEDTLGGRGYNATGKMLPEGRGRVWPIFTGERGHYELAKAGAHLDTATLNQLRNTYIKAMELFSNEGHMIPEQIWDGIGNNDAYHFRIGQGTNSATPLAWSHAEYIKLLRSYADGKVWDSNESTKMRYADQRDLEVTKK